MQDAEDEPLFAERVAGLDIAKAGVDAAIRVPSDTCGCRKPAPRGADAPPHAIGAVPRPVVGAENLRHQAIFMNHAPHAVTALNPELIQVGDAIG
jgi:hypothetical protein